MKEHREEHYWSRFANSYDRDGEYVVGKRILQAIEEELLKERSPDELVFLVERAGFQVEDVQLLEDGANALYLKGTKK